METNPDHQDIKDEGYREVDQPRFVRLVDSYIRHEGVSGQVIELWTARYGCPQCGKSGVWRMGVHFDHEMRCPDRLCIDLSYGNPAKHTSRFLS